MSVLVTYVFSWHALSDACPKCRSLHMKEWRESELYKNTVSDPIWGDVWDLDSNRSLAHPNCRCRLTVRVEQASTDEFEQLIQLVHTLNVELRQLLDSEVLQV